MRLVGCIFARGGSKGLPGKNIRLFSGKPLIAWSIEQAKSINRIERLIVSTDSLEIASVALAYGAEVPFIRPTELAEDESPEWLAWRHALEYLKEVENYFPESMVSIPATAPLRLPGDIDRCIDKYVETSADIVITVTKSHRNPWFNMVKKKSDGTVELVMPPEAPIYRRQDAPKVYDMTTVAYVARVEYIMKESEIFAGHVEAVEIPTARSIDIDTLMDFKTAEMLKEINDS